MGEPARKLVHVDRRAIASPIVGGKGGGVTAVDPWSKLGPYLCKLYRQWESERETEGPCAGSE